MFIPLQSPCQMDNFAFTCECILMQDCNGFSSLLMTLKSSPTTISSMVNQRSLLNILVTRDIVHDFGHVHLSISNTIYVDLWWCSGVCLVHDVLLPLEHDVVSDKMCWMSPGGKTLLWARCARIDDSLLSSLSFRLLSVTLPLPCSTDCQYCTWEIRSSAFILCRFMKCDGSVMGTTASLLRSSVPMIDFALGDIDSILFSL